METTSPPLVVLVHGAWHGAWCWSALQAELDSRGIASIAVDLPGHGASALPLTDLPGDAAHLSLVIARLDRPVVLVGHSYGGAVITEAMADTDTARLTRHLVYVAAFALTPGESVYDVIFTSTPPPIAIAGAVIPAEDGTTSIDPSRAPAAFYAHCPPDVAAAAVARLDRQTAVSFTQKTTGSIAVQSTYVRCTQDEAIHISHQDVMAARCDQVVTLDTDHSPFASRVGEMADLLEQCAVGAVSGS